MLYDPGGTCTVLAYRPVHFCLRPKLEYRLPLVVLSRLNRFTLSHYGSRTPLSTLHAGLTASHARLSTGCLLGFAGSGLSPDYTIHAELAHNLRTLRPEGRSILRTFFQIKNPCETIDFTGIFYFSFIIYVRKYPRAVLRLRFHLPNPSPWPPVWRRPRRDLQRTVSRCQCGGQRGLCYSPHCRWHQPGLRV